MTRADKAEQTAQIAFARFQRALDEALNSGNEGEAKAALARLEMLFTVDSVRLRAREISS